MKINKSIILSHIDPFDKLQKWCTLACTDKMNICLPMLRAEHDMLSFPSNGECLRCSHRKNTSSDPLRGGWNVIYGRRKIRGINVPIPDVKPYIHQAKDENHRVSNYFTANAWHFGKHDA